MRVCLVYLACPVIKIVDSQYLARFWPQYEAWLSFQAVTMDGLLPTLRTERLAAIWQILFKGLRPCRRPLYIGPNQDVLIFPRSIFLDIWEMFLGIFQDFDFLKN